MDNLTNEKSKFVKAAAILMIIVSVYFLIKIVAEIKELRFIGGGATASNTISFSGIGEVFAAPDMATVNFTIRDDEKALKAAQDKVTAKEKVILSFLTDQGIDKKDIKTENYSSYPKYDYGTPCYSGMGIPCPRVEPKIIGYEVSEYMSVKVHDLAKTGEIVKGIGAIGVSDMNGPNFSVEDEDQLKEQARKMAIDDAKDKANALSKDLGVSLIRIVNFSENGNYPMPMYLKADSMMGAESSAPAPSLPAGENKITSNVTITYEIR